METTSLVGIPMEHGLAVAGILFTLGLAGVMMRRDILFMLMSLEIMMNSASLAFVVACALLPQPALPIIFFLFFALAASHPSFVLLYSSVLGNCFFFPFVFLFLFFLFIL